MMEPNGGGAPLARLAADVALDSLPLPHSKLRALRAAGICLVSDLDGMDAGELATEIGVRPPEAAKLIAEVRSIGASTKPPTQSAMQLYDEELSSRRISTLVKALDSLLGGGVQPRVLTEFSGVPGVGKTQLAMQLAVAVQVPVTLGGVDGDAVYIDTEGSFVAERALQMAEGLLAELRVQAMEGGWAEPRRSQLAALVSRGAGSLLAGIHVFRTHSKEEQLSVLRQLPVFNRERSRPVRLVIVDSVAFHFRHDGGGRGERTDFSKRIQSLGHMAQCLTSLAAQQGVAVVAVNQVTTRINEANGDSWLVPALGDSWAHACRLQLLMQWVNGTRVASLYKGGPPGQAAYDVTPAGVRGVSPNLTTPQHLYPQGAYTPVEATTMQVASRYEREGSTRKRLCPDEVGRERAAYPSRDG